MNKRIAIIVAYFGKLPNCFMAWWTSALYNPEFEFWFFTDNVNINSEGNITVKHMPFKDFTNIIQKNFDFKIECSSPYKLCDFRPAYGEIFKEDLKGYDGWGYCDIDLVYGNMQKFITDEMIEEYDKILIDGHTSIFKNNEHMNRLYRVQGVYPEYNYQEAFTTTDSCYFDEYRGMELKLIREKCKIYYNGSVYINAEPRKPVFYGSNGRRAIGIWEQGNLFSVDDNGVRHELLYFHVCKRKMDFIRGTIENPIKKMSIVPGKIICNDDTPLDKLFDYTSGGRLYRYLWLVKRLKTQLKRYSIIKIIQLNSRRKQVKEYRDKLIAESK
ncbi:DUF6625 family protein [Oribacterium sp. P6A1]|uniref:DUF6625 family protein n=1 Tax=Oribacterium sp. P6A1 TaxID=1410612 RepID=UPI00068AB9D8|nr:DUF6625 family protein [Oribacterium sp. P6A1]